jgi:hypothetical protein
MRDDFSKKYEERDENEIFSRPVKAGKRTYFFDVKATRENDYYLTITESKRRVDRDGKFTYDKHKIFLYKEDFDKFVEGLQEVIGYVKQNAPEIKPREDRSDDSSLSYSNVNFDDLK